MINALQIKRFVFHTYPVYLYDTRRLKTRPIVCINNRMLRNSLCIIDKVDQLYRECFTCNSYYENKEEIHHFMKKPPISQLQIVNPRNSLSWYNQFEITGTSGGGSVIERYPSKLGSQSRQTKDFRAGTCSGCCTAQRQATGASVTDDLFTVCNVR